MSLKLTKLQLIAAIIDFFQDQKESEYKACRNCNHVYLPLKSDDPNVSVCLRCKHPNELPEHLRSIKLQSESKGK